jgi:hypothetical protein
MTIPCDRTTPVKKRRNTFEFDGMVRFRGCVIIPLHKAACTFFSLVSACVFVRHKHEKTNTNNRRSKRLHHKRHPSPITYFTMLATSSALIRRSAPRIVSVLAQSSKKTFPVSASVCLPFDAFYSDSEQNHSTTTIRYYSAVPAEERRPGSVTKTLRVLDMDVVKQIMEELRSVDVNSDGR